MIHHAFTSTNTSLSDASSTFVGIKLILASCSLDSLVDDDDDIFSSIISILLFLLFLAFLDL